ncbi:MAG: hypothetical protein P8X64_00045 [Anaerolineales bacterium]|jgi:hypothetical protein
MTEDMKPEAEPLEETPVEKPSAPAPAGTAGPTLAGRIGRVLLRLLLVLVLGAALGAGLYYGAIKLYRDAIEPLRTIDSRFEDLQFQIDRLASDQENSATQTRKRLAELEGRAAAINEQLSELEAKAGIQREDLSGLSSRLEDVDQLQDQLDELIAEQEALNTRMQDVEDMVAGQELPAQQVARNLQLLRAMTIMTRARLSLNQLNLGLAQSDLGAASDILTILVGGQPGGDETAPAEPELNQASDHLQAALREVLSRPAVAEDELEIAWKLLIDLTSSTLAAPITSGTE